MESEESDARFFSEPAEPVQTSHLSYETDSALDSLCTGGISSTNVALSSSMAPRRTEGRRNARKTEFQQAPLSSDGSMDYNFRDTWRTISEAATSARTSSEKRQSRKGNMLARAIDFARQNQRGAPQAVHGASSKHIFADADAEKDAIHKNIEKKEYDVADFYKEKGCAQALAKNKLFGTITLALISVNSLWIGFEIQVNTESNLNDAEWYFQLGEYFFCAFFMFEWGTRYAAFKRKCDGLRDKWFCFDAFLVFVMVIETLILPQVLQSLEEESDKEGQDGQDVGNFSVLRMLRLLRLTRMVRFMRAMPELVTLVQSMRIACRPVLSTLGLLLMMIYMFAIVFKSQLNPRERTLVWWKFGRVTSSMWTLFFSGTLLDDVTKVAKALAKENILVTAAFILFILLSSFTLLNLLVGMLCEVVNVVATSEKEKAMVSYVKQKLIAVLEDLDEDGSGMISKSEFDSLMNVPSAVRAINDLGVDVSNLMSLSDHLFVEDDIPAQKGNRRTQLDAMPETFDTVTDRVASMSVTPMGSAPAGRTSVRRSRMSVNQRVIRESFKKAASKESSLPRESKRLSRAQAPEPLILDAEDGQDRGEDNSESGPSARPYAPYGHLASSSSMFGQEESEDEEEDEGKELSFGDFIETVIRLRAENRPSVIDIIDLRKLYLRGEQQMLQELDTVADMTGTLAKELDMLVINHPFYKMLRMHPDIRKKSSGRKTLREKSGRSRSSLEPDESALARAFDMADATQDIGDLDALANNALQANEADVAKPSSGSRLPRPDHDALARAFAAVDDIEAPGPISAPFEGSFVLSSPWEADAPRVNLPTEFELPLPRPESLRSDFLPHPDDIQFLAEESDLIDAIPDDVLPSDQRTEPDRNALGRALALAGGPDDSWVGEGLPDLQDEGPDDIALESALALVGADDDGVVVKHVSDARASALRHSVEQFSSKPDSDALDRALLIGGTEPLDLVDNSYRPANADFLNLENSDGVASSTFMMGDGEPLAQDVNWYRTGPGTPDASALRHIIQAAASAELDACNPEEVVTRSLTAQSL